MGGGGRMGSEFGEESECKVVGGGKEVKGLSDFSLFGDGLPKEEERVKKKKGGERRRKEEREGRNEEGNVEKARKWVFENVEKGRGLGREVEACDVRLREMGERIRMLEAALGPLQAQSKLVQGLGSGMEKAMGPAGAVLKVFENVHELEKVVLVEPGEDVGGYLASVSRLEDALEFLSNNCPVAVQWLQEAVDFVSKSGAGDKYRMHRLNEALSSLRHAEFTSATLDGGLLGMAMKVLESQFRKLVQKHSSPVGLPESVPVGQEGDGGAGARVEDSRVPGLPAGVIHNLQAIVQKLATSQQKAELEVCVEAYVEARRLNALESLKQLDTQYLHCSSPEELNLVNWDDLELQIGLWTQQVEVAVKLLYGPERQLCSQVFGKAGGDVWRECFMRLSQEGMSLLLQFAEGVIRSQKTPEKLFKFLDMFEAVENFTPSVLEVFEGDVCSEMRLRVRELQKQIVHGCCQVVWQFSNQLLEGQNEGPLPEDGMHAKLSSYVVNYVKYLVSEFYGPIMAQVLKIEQSWRGGGGEETQAQALTQKDVLANAVISIMQSLERNVESRAKAYKDAALAHIFLMNNIQYMYDRSSKCELAALLGESWFKEHRRKVEQHSLGYQKEGWAKVIAHLNRDGLLVSTGGNRAAKDLVKQRLRYFTTTLEQAIEKQSEWSIPDPHLRQTVIHSVVQAVQSAYRTFIQSYGSLLDQAASATRYPKYTPENVESMLLSELFLGPSRYLSSSSSRNHYHSRSSSTVGD